MKKYTLHFWFIALMALITSCSQDAADALTANPVDDLVTFTAMFPQDPVPNGTSRNATRAAMPTAPAGYQLRCILEVWSEDLTTLKVRVETPVMSGADNVQFTFELNDPAKYKALLWADYIALDAKRTDATIGDITFGHYADKYYTTNDATNGLKAVQTHYVSLIPEAKDAFCTAESFEKGATALTGLTATMTRPLTKLTVAEKNTANFAYCRKVNAIYNIPRYLNVATGATSEIVENQVSLTSGDGSDFGKEIIIKGTPCQVLFSAYIFAEADGTMDEINLSFEATDASHKVLKPVTIPAGIPARRNYCINAAGTLIVVEDEPSPNTSMTVDINSDWKSTKEEHEITVAKVGDYYYENGSYSSTYTNDALNPCIGIVFVVNADGKSGKIVGLTEKKNLAWSTEQVETKADDLNKGRTNMETIAKYISDNSKSWDDYPAFKWVKETMNGNTGNWDAANDKWYLPAKEEFRALYGEYTGETNVNDNVKTVVNSSLAKVGKATLSTYYWSSTEYRSTDSWTVNFSNGFSNNFTKTYTTYSTRCVREF